MRLNLLANMSLVLGSLLLFLLAGELTVRMLGVFSLQEEEQTFYRPNPNLTVHHFELAPQTEGTMFLASVRTNNLGFRGGDYSPPKAEGVKRIFVLGDSNTFGLGVGNKDTYARQLELRLTQQSPPPLLRSGT